jgi:hypothetical protein
MHLSTKPLILIDMTKNKIKDDEKKESKVEKKEIKARVWFYLIPAFAIIFFAVYLLFSIAFGTYQEAGKTFTYQGLTFDKQENPGLNLFHYSYIVNSQDGRTVKNNIYLRIDPRENKVPVFGDVLLFPDEEVYVAMEINPLLNCPNIVRDSTLLPYFLVNNFIKVNIGSADIDEALENNSTYVTCEEFPNNKVILIKKGEGTNITIDGHCYSIQVSECQLLDASEKFQVEMILDSRLA